MQIALSQSRDNEKIVINTFSEFSIVAEYRDIDTNEVMWAQRISLAALFSDPHKSEK